MHVRTFLLLAVLLPSAALAAAPATGPTSAPATRPVDVDLSSPKATLVSLGNAFEQGDADAVAKCFVDNALLRETYQRIMPLLTPSYRLDATLRKKFGKGLDAVPNGSALFRADMIDAAVVKIDGERATVTFFEAQEWLLRRVDGRWLLDPGEDEGVTREAVDAMLAMGKEAFEPINKAVAEALRGIEAGRLTSRQAVLDDLETTVDLPVVGND